MTRRRDPFMMALDSLRSRAERGVFVPGTPVVILEEARRLNLSTTPVREALVWLSGYGLMERSPMGGFLAPRLDPAVVRDRYAFRLQCVVGGLASHPRTAGDLAGPDGPERDLPEQMLRAVKGTGNAALVDAYQRVCRQLLLLATAERRLFPDLDDEEARLIRAFEIGADDLVDSLAAYHERRIHSAPLLILEAEAARETSIEHD